LAQNSILAAIISLFIFVSVIVAISLKNKKNDREIDNDRETIIQIKEDKLEESEDESLK
jgi:hypothetical protein